MAVDIDSLQIEIEATSNDAAKKIEALATALTGLRTAAKGGAGLTTTTKQLQALSNAAKLINGTNLDSKKIQQFSSAMNSLSAIQKASGLNSTINALKKLPEISAALDKADLGKLAVQMNQVASALRPLANEMQKVANGFSAFPIRIQKIIQSNTGLAASNQKAAKSFGVLGTGISSTKAQFGIYSVLFREIARVVSDWVKESNDYVENLNLFTVAMGDAAESALEYAEAVKEAVGIDPSEWIRNQGVFKQITSGFGVMEENANLMSKNLTQLGYDISSFYNISIEDAMQKLQSGIAGEIEPLRRLGYAIDVATLQEVAYAHGIEQSVNSMNQAQKSQLRYLAIMEQSGNVMGDMARTVQTPANALRILDQQITQLSRALGNMLIPILQQIIPWVQAFVEVLTEAAQAIANLLGFELPNIDYSGLEGVSAGATDASDALGEAADAAKKLQHYTLGIDELNIISPSQAAGAGAGVGGSEWNLDLPEYDFLNGLLKDTDELKNQLREILYDYVIPIAAGLTAWKLASSLVQELTTLQGILGALMVAVGISLLIDSIEDIIIDGNLSWENVLEGGAGGAIAGAGLGFMLAQKWGLSWKKGMLTGAVIGAGLALVIMAITSELKAGLKIDNAILGAVGGAVSGAGIGNLVALKMGASLVSGTVLGATIGVGLTMTIMGIISEIKEGVNLANGLLTTIGSGIVGAGIGFTIGGPVGALVGLALGLIVGLVLTAKIAKIQRDEVSYQNAVQEIKQQAIMTITEATDLFSEWYSTWLPNNQVVLELITTKEGLAQDIADAYTALQSTFETITQDGKIARDELTSLTEAMNNYFAAITMDTSANNDIIHEALVGALGRASEDGVGYYQALIDKHNEWIINEQGALGALQQQVSNASAALATATPDTTEYTEALDAYNKALQNLNNFSSAENKAKLQMYSEQIEQLKTAINSGQLDITQLEQAKDSLETIAQKFQTTLQDIETAKEGVMLAVQTEINRATALGDSGSIVSLGDIKAGLEADFEAQRSEVIEAANGIGATIAEAIGNQMFNLMQTTDTGTIQKMVDDYYVPILETWTEGAKGVITNSEELKAFPQLTLDTMMDGWANLEPDLDETGYAALDTWNQKLVDSAKSSLDSVLKETDLGPQAQAFMDALTVPFGEANVDKSAIQTGINGFVSAVEEAAGIHSPATIMIPVGESLMAGIEKGFSTTPDLSTAFDAELTEMRTAADTFRLGLETEVIDATLVYFLSELESAKGSNQEFTEAMETSYKTMAENSVSAIESIISSLDSIPRNITTIHTVITETKSVGSSARTYASGGFPETGQMFIARENGPELVGAIGRRTAVANNAQIVEGISAGVESANVQQNALLREQNDLLRAILAKEGTVKISNKAIKQAYDTASRQSGASIMPGGVMR